MLTGIRFIPKTEREKQCQQQEKKQKDKKDKKEKKAKKHKKEGREKKRKREREELSSSSEDEDAEEEEEFNILKEEERMKELIEEMNQQEGITNFKSHLLEKEEGAMKKPRRIPINDSENKDDEDEEEEEEERPVIVELSSNEINDYPDTTPRSESPHPPSTNTEIESERKCDTSTNHGYASLLRERLKNPSLSNQVLPSHGSKTASTAASSEISFMSKEEMKWMSSYTRRTSNSDKIDDEQQPKSSSVSSRYKILDDREDDIDSILVSNILKKGTNFKGTELGLSSVSLSREGIGTGDRSGKDEGNENGDGDLDMRMLVSKERKLNDDQIAKKIIQKAEKTSKLYAQIVDNCSRCPNSKFYRSHRTICSGRHIELRLKPNTFSLDPEWHCELVPITHVPSILRSLDNDADGEDGQGILRELERFKSCLIAMFERDGKGVAFMETAIHAGLKTDEISGTQRISKHHTVVDVIPFEQGMQGEISMFFYQAFQTSGEEWSTHKTRILTINNQDRPLQKVIPSRFPYIAVEWSSSGSQDSSREGVAHVVEDSSYFTNHFCLDVIAGALDIDPFILRKLSNSTKKSSRNDISSDGGGGGGNQDDERIERVHVDKFRQAWSSFDWTQYME